MQPQPASLTARHAKCKYPFQYASYPRFILFQAVIKGQIHFRLFFLQGGRLFGQRSSFSFQSDCLLPVFSLPLVLVLISLCEFFIGLYDSATLLQFTELTEYLLFLLRC